MARVGGFACLIVLSLISRSVHAAPGGDAAVAATDTNAAQTSARSASGQATIAASHPMVLPTGRLPLQFEPSRPTGFGPADVVRIDGLVKGTAAAAVALRIDDAHSTTYASRFDDERLLPPGPFRLAVPLQGLPTPSGRRLDAGAITRLILFAWAGSPDVEITRFEIAAGPRMPSGAHGYAFGAADAPLPAGFERVGSDDGRLTSRMPIRAIRRPAPDPLVSSGLSGVDSIVLAARAPRVRVTVWSEDPGEWETLPHPLVRTLRVNGQTLVDERSTAAQWIERRYLRGATIEHTAADDAWSAYGALRGDEHSIDVEAPDGRIVIDLAGPTPDALFINAAVVEPISAGADAATPAPGREFADAQRAEWYRSHFPVAAQTRDRGDGVVSRSFAFAASDVARQQPVQLRAAPDSGVRVRLSLTTDRDIARPQLTFAPPHLGATTLKTRLWTRQWRLERDGPLLRLGDDRLIADTASSSLHAGVGRGYDLWIDIPANASPGLYEGALTLADGPEARRIPIELTVLDVRLPKAPKPAGFYLAGAPHFAAFAGFTLERERQVGCDLDLLSQFGLTNTAPPIGGVDQADTNRFATDMRRAADAGVAPGWLVYNPLADLIAARGVDAAAGVVQRLDEFARARGLPAPLWSAADEPSNPGPGADDIRDVVLKLRQASPGVHLAGHLNAPGDLWLVSLFDTVLINPGFGIDADRLAKLSTLGHAIWLYNTGAPRQTAGVWLHATAAERYLQWHARMPTADPFDPLDGREGDFQVIFPSAKACPAQPDIHPDLLAMAEGIVDQRWLAWLDAQTSEPAHRLASDLRADRPDTFAAVARMTSADLDAMRGRIMDLAAARAN